MGLVWRKATIFIIIYRLWRIVKPHFLKRLTKKSVIFHKKSVPSKSVESKKKTKKIKKYYNFWKNLLTNAEKDDKIVNCIIIARIVGYCELECDLYSSKLHKKQGRIASQHTISPRALPTI